MAYNLSNYSTTQVDAYNTAARSLTISVGEKRSLSLATGLGIRTVERWFTVSTQQRRLVVPSVAGSWVWNNEQVLGRATAIRLTVGELLTEGMTRETGLTGTEKTRDFAFAYLGDASEIALDIRAGSYDWFLASAWYKMTLVYSEEGGWFLTVFYRGVGRGQSSDALTDTPERGIDVENDDSDAGEIPWP